MTLCLLCVTYRLAAHSDTTPSVSDLRINYFSLIVAYIGASLALILTRVKLYGRLSRFRFRSYITPTS